VSERSWNDIDTFAERICDDRCGVPGNNGECDGGSGRGEWHLLTEREKDEWRKTAELLGDVVENDDEVHQETVSELSEAQDELSSVAASIKEVKDAHDKMLDFVNGLREHPFVAKGATRGPKPDLRAFVDEMMHQLNAISEVITRFEEN